MFSLRGFATVAFGPLVEKSGDLFAVVKTSLPRANIRIPYKTYVSVALMISLFSFLSSFGVTAIALMIIKVPMILFISYLLFVPMMVGILSFILIIFYPNQKAAGRKRNIETNLPFVLTHMGSVAASGVPPYVIFRLISQFMEYGEISKEMGKIVRNIENFGLDPLTSVKEVADKTPSDDFKQVLLGFVTTTESGGDIKQFLKNAGDQALFDWRIKREKFLQQLSAYAEFYTGLLIAAPLFIISLFAVMNLIQPSIGGYTIIDLMKLSIYLIVPIMNAGFILFLRGVEVEM